LVAGLLLIDPGTMTDIIGVILLGLLTFIQYRKAKSNRSSLGDSIAAAN
jgi:UPF0716 family protein affecting phage T7 exclusion